MSVWLRRIVNRLVTPVDRPAPDDLDIIPGLFPPVPEKVARELRALDDTIERRIANYDSAIDSLAAEGDWAGVDVLLDARNRIRPPRPAPVPVIPGRSS